MTGKNGADITRGDAVANGIGSSAIGGLTRLTSARSPFEAMVGPLLGYTDWAADERSPEGIGEHGGAPAGLGTRDHAP